MRYLGRKDFQEGSIYPCGLHWGFIRSYGSEVRIEHYALWRLRLPYSSRWLPNLETGSPVRIKHRFYFLVFISFPTENFPEGKRRFRLTGFWNPHDA